MIPGALRFRDYRRFWAGSFTANVGMWTQQIALGYLVYDLTRQATWLGLIAVCGNLPTLLLGLVGGALADRMSRRLVMTAAVLILAGGATMLSVLTASSYLVLWHIPAIAALSGIAAALYTPAMHSTIPSLVDDEHLVSAITLNSVQFNLARAVGPAVAGLLYGVVGAAGCFAINASGFLTLAVILNTIDLPPRPAAAPAPMARALRDGIRYASGHHTIARLITLTAIISLFTFPYIVLLPALARDTLGLGATGLAYLTASMGVGAVTGGLVATAVGNPIRQPRITSLGCIAIGTLMGGFLIARDLPWVAALLAAGGFVQTITVSSVTTQVQTLVDDDMRGRVMSMITVVLFGFTTFGGLVFGIIADRAGVPATLAGGGAVTIVAATLVTLRPQRGVP